MMSLLVSLRMSLQDYKRLETMAKVYRMSVTEYIETVVHQDLTKCKKP